MKIKNIISVIAGFLSFFLLWGTLFPYDNKVAHRTFNEYIIKFAEENQDRYFPSNYEFNLTADNTGYKGMAVTEGGFLNSTEGEEAHTIFDWIIHGGYSADEPEVPASVRHFYDPVQLTGVKYLTNEGTVWEHHYPNPHTDAIEWAIGDTPKGAENKWTLLKGKEYIIKALETADEETKNANFAKAFRCLGEVLHNTGDMGCPPHTRNDSHAAPIGYRGGAIFASPDPYEESFQPSFIPTFWEDDPDPDLKAFCDNATTIRSIHEKLAQFTNANLFTKETINGMGYQLITPINVEGTYPSPLLQDFDYNRDNYTYSKILPYNNFKIIMAKDKSYLGRTYPYIDRECVRNQAEYLVPNIMCAGANVVRLFIPRFEVKIKSVKSSGEIEGTVIHKQTGEYASGISYSGKIFVYDNQSLKKIGEANCENGNFSGTISNIGAHDEIYAELKMAGINIISETYDLNSEKTVTGCLITVGNIEATVTAQYAGSAPAQADGWYSDDFYSHADDPATMITFQNDEYQNTFDYTSSSGIHYSGTARVEFDEDLNNILKFSVNRKKEYKPDKNDGYTIESSLSGHDIPIDPNSVTNIWFKIKGSETCEKIDNMSYVYTTVGYTETKEMKNCTPDSRLEILVMIKQ